MKIINYFKQKPQIICIPENTLYTIECDPDCIKKKQPPLVLKISEEIYPLSEFGCYLDEKSTAQCMMEFDFYKSVTDAIIEKIIKERAEYLDIEEIKQSVYDNEYRSCWNRIGYKR